MVDNVEIRAGRRHASVGEVWFFVFTLRCKHGESTNPGEPSVDLYGMCDQRQCIARKVDTGSRVRKQSGYDREVQYKRLRGQGRQMVYGSWRRRIGNVVSHQNGCDVGGVKS